MTVDEENFLCGLKLVLMNIRLESPRRKAGRKLAVKHLHNHNMAKHTLGGGGGGEKKRKKWKIKRGFLTLLSSRLLFEVGIYKRK